MWQRRRVTEFSFETLRRWPDVEAPNLLAYDATDRLLLDEAAAALGGESVDAAGGPREPGNTDGQGQRASVGALGVPDARQIVVIGDRYGALTLGAASAMGLPGIGTHHDPLPGIRTHQDALTGELALAANAERVGLSGAYQSLPLGESLLAGARVVLLQLPRSLAELEEIADQIARFAADDVVVFAGGRIKHLSLAMNGVLAAYFDTVRPTLARQKSRVLVAAGVRRPSAPPPYPKSELNAELGLVVAAHGGAFSGTSLDIGTRYLLEFLGRVDSAAQTAVDLGCGTGILAAELAVKMPRLRVIATDQSAAAVLSARATVTANGLDDRVSVVRDTGLAQQLDASVDVIVCNPPFHLGGTVHTGAASAMFRDAARVLRPGGQLFTVFNSHLAYQTELRRVVGPTTVLGQNTKFTVTASTRAAADAAE